MDMSVGQKRPISQLGVFEKLRILIMSYVGSKIKLQTI
jgi:hypothetical protein